LWLLLRLDLGYGCDRSCGTGAVRLEEGDRPERGGRASPGRARVRTVPPV